MFQFKERIHGDSMSFSHLKSHIKEEIVEAVINGCGMGELNYFKNFPDNYCPRCRGPYPSFVWVNHLCRTILVEHDWGDRLS